MTTRPVLWIVRRCVETPNGYLLDLKHGADFVFAKSDRPFAEGVRVETEGFGDGRRVVEGESA